MPDDRPPPMRRPYARIGIAGAGAAFAILAATIILAPRHQTACVLAMLTCAWLLAISIMLLLTDLGCTKQDTAVLQLALAQALTDPVTGLPVRRVAENLITDAGPEVLLTVAIVDVDRLHAFNNQYGHTAGDLYLLGIAERLREAAGDGGLAARLGGDEFAVVSMHTPTDLAAALARALHVPVTIAGRAQPIGVSIGICQLSGGDPHMLFGCADLAMFTARRRGSRIEHYDQARDGIPLPPGTRPAVRLREQHNGTLSQQGLRPLPHGLLECPQCGSGEMAAIEQSTCRECGSQAGADEDAPASTGVQCLLCRWSYHREDWKHRVAEATLIRKLGIKHDPTALFNGHDAVDGER